MLLGPGRGPQTRRTTTAAALRPVERTRRKQISVCVCERVCARMRARARTLHVRTVRACWWRHGCTWREKVPRASEGPPSRHLAASRIRPCIFSVAIAAKVSAFATKNGYVGTWVSTRRRRREGNCAKAEDSEGAEGEFSVRKRRKARARVDLTIIDGYVYQAKISSR